MAESGPAAIPFPNTSKFLINLVYFITSPLLNLTEYILIVLYRVNYHLLLIICPANASITNSVSVKFVRQEGRI